MENNRRGLERFDALVARLRAHNTKHGFIAPSRHNDKRSATATLAHLMLIVTELAEAAQEVRKHGKEPCLDTFRVELADAFLRLLDLADRHGIDLVKGAEIKMTINEKREYRHGRVIL